MARQPHSVRFSLIVAVFGLVATSTHPTFADFNEDLVGYWSFDNPSDPAHDDSGNGNNGTNHGATWIPHGVLGGALDFDGMADYLTIPLSTSTTITITAWIKPDTGTDTTQAILDRENSFVYQYGNSSVAISKMVQYSYQGDQLISNTELEVGSWSFVTLVRTPSTVSFYLNGAYDGGGATSPRSLVGTFCIGSRQGDTHQFDGSIDEVRIYDRALSPAEVHDLYADLNEGLIAHWPLNEGQGSLTEDVAGDHDGTVHGGAMWVSGVEGYALEFDGTDDYVEVADHDSLSFGNGSGDFPFTLSAWINRVAPSSFNVIASKYRGGYPRRQEYALVLRDDDTVRITAFDTTDDYRLSLKSDVAVGAGWHHVVATYDGSASANGLTLYIDGAESPATIELDDPRYVAMHNTTEPFRVGAQVVGDGTLRFFQGVVDDVRVYDRVLSPAEVGELYGGGPGNQPPVADAGGPYAGSVGAPVIFDASESYDPDGEVVGYRWDWTNDNAWDTDWLTDPVIAHGYDEEFSGEVRLQVKDDHGQNHAAQTSRGCSSA